MCSLAFAVAAHLEPEILVVDEVLAVGDAEFQKKCLGKMDEVASHGRTILFVSHNMGAVLGLCSRVACLVKGSLKSEGTPQTVVNRYLAYAGSLAPKAIRELSPDVAVAVERCEVEIVKPARGRLHLRLAVELNVHERASVAIELVIRDTLGVPVGWASVGALNSGQKLNLLPGRIGVTSLHNVSALGDGRYSLSIMISRPIPGPRSLGRLPAIRTERRTPLRGESAVAARLGLWRRRVWLYLSTIYSWEHPPTLGVWPCQASSRVDSRICRLLLDKRN